VTFSIPKLKKKADPLEIGFPSHLPRLGLE
jgi:hypothetical protein